jgi:hypothetical protein
MFTLVFAITCTIAGTFTIYFGSGKSKITGGIITIAGIIVFIIFLYGANLLSGLLGTPEGILNFQGTIVNGITAIVGAFVGAGLAIGIFILSIVKT